MKIVSYRYLKALVRQGQLYQSELNEMLKYACVDYMAIPLDKCREVIPLCYQYEITNEIR